MECYCRLLAIKKFSMLSTCFLLNFALFSPIFSQSSELQIPDFEANGTFEFAGYMEFVCDPAEANYSGKFHFAKRNGETIYSLLFPDTTCTTVKQCEETIIEDFYDIIITSNQGAENPTVIERATIQSRSDRKIGPRFAMFDMYLSKEVVAIRSFVNAGILTKISEHQYINILEPPVGKGFTRKSELTVDNINRIVRAESSWARLPNKQYAEPEMLYEFAYAGQDIFPSRIFLSCPKWPGSIKGATIDFTIARFGDDVPTSFTPTLLEKGMNVTDHRFTPQLQYVSESTKFPTDEELFAIAEKQKRDRAAMERELRANQQRVAEFQAVANNPRNIKDVPITKRSWTRYFRLIPNWVYGGAVVLVFFGWIVSKRRKN